MELQVKYILDSWLHAHLPTTFILSLDWMDFYNFLGVTMLFYNFLDLSCLFVHDYVECFSG